MSTETTSIAEQLVALKQGAAQQLPAEIHAAVAGEQAALNASGPPAGVPAVGSTLEDAELLDAHGEPIGLYSAIGPRDAVIVFYRGSWCPYCNLTLNAYQQQLLPELAAREVELVAVSPQKPDESLSMAEKNALSFPVLSDPGNQLASALGILSSPSAEAGEAQRRLGLDIATSNADGTAEIPMPTTLILDTARTVAWIDVHPDYTTRTEPAAILGALDAIRGATSPAP